MKHVEDISQQVCSLQDIEPGTEWEWLQNFEGFFSVGINLNRECGQQNPVAVDAEIQALVYETSSKDGVVVYTDGSLVQHMRSSWKYVSTGRRAVKEDCGYFVLTTNSLTMEIIAVTKAMAWLESH